MGIRIQKDIGYIISMEKVASIFVPEYKEILEELAEDDELTESFFEKIAQEMTQYQCAKNTAEGTVMRIFATHFVENCKRDTIEPFHLIQRFLMADDDVGVLIRSPELYKASRRDDLIDYYECSIYAHDIKYLNRPIYPTTGYIYNGGLEAEHPELVIGQVYGNFEISNEYLANHKLSFSYHDQQQQSDEIVASGIFSPNIEALAFLIAKSSGLLLPYVTEHIFNMNTKPMIATYWS